MDTSTPESRRLMERNARKAGQQVKWRGMSYASTELASADADPFRHAVNQITRQWQHDRAKLALDLLEGMSLGSNAMARPEEYLRLRKQKLSIAHDALPAPESKKPRKLGYTWGALDMESFREIDARLNKRGFTKKGSK